MGADLLLVDDEIRVVRAITRALRERLDLEVEGLSDPRQAVAVLRERPPKVLVTDFDMPHLNGVQVLEEARRSAPGAVRILLTARAAPWQIVEAINVGRIFRFVAKPWDDDALAGIVREALEAHEAYLRRRADDAERQTLRTAVESVGLLQRSLFPDRVIALDHADVACSATPCEHATGDYVDVIPLGRRTAIFTGDVAGHGVEAAVFTFTARALLRSSLLDGAGLPETLARTNRMLCHDMQAGRFFTLFAGIHDPADATLSYLNAGHVAPMLVGPQGLRELGRTSLPLGLVEEASFGQEVRVPFAEGETLVAFTDGVTEARNARDELFGLSRLRAELAGQGACAPEERLLGLEAALEAYGGPGCAEDDLTLLAYRPRVRRGAPLPA